MRITGGEFSGRRLVTSAAMHARPTQDRVREALFSILATRLGGCAFVDLFAGTGAAGLEALSRGAASVVWVENSPAMFKVLTKNLAMLGVHSRSAMREDVFSFLRRSAAGGYDIVFADPPYAQRGGVDYVQKLLENDHLPRILRPDGLLVIEQGAREALREPSGWQFLDNRKYGQSRILLYSNGA